MKSAVGPMNYEAVGFRVSVPAAPGCHGHVIARPHSQVMKTHTLSCLALAAALLSAVPASAQIDLSAYRRVAIHDLPVATSGANLLAREASAVTYNWDSDTLFVVGDGGTSIVEVSLTGQLIGSMALTGFTSQSVGDPEGLTYAGGGNFVMSLERARKAAQFSYSAGGTLATTQTRQVALGTPIGNIGNEGISYDPLTGGYIVVKQEGPLGIFQTNIDFDALSASNGSAATANPVNLFDPALMGLSMLSDVQALSTAATFAGSDAGHLLVLSKNDGRLIEVDREGRVFGSLSLGLAPGSTAAETADLGHEGVTIDRLGRIYIVNEEGGGNSNAPQLWVYAPVPEASTWAMFAGGLALLVSTLRRRRAA